MAHRLALLFSPLRFPRLRSFQNWRHFFFPPCGYGFHVHPFSADTTNPNSTSKESAKLVELLRNNSKPKNIIEIMNRCAKDPALLHNHNVYKAAAKRLKALKALKEVEQIAERILSSRKSSIEGLLVRAIYFYADAGMRDHVVKTFLRHKAFKILPTADLFNAFLSSLVDCRNPKMACDYFKKAREFNVFPNLTSCNIVIKALCDMKEHDLAIQFVGLMKDKGFQPNVVSYDTILDSVFHYWQEERIDSKRKKKLLDKLIECCESEVISYGLRIRRFCKEDKVSEAQALMEETFSKGLNVDAYAVNSLVIAFCKKKQLVEAKKLFFEMLDSDTCRNKHSYNMITRFLSESGDLKTAMELLQKMLDMNWVPDATTVHAVMSALFEYNQGETEAAQLLIEKLNAKMPSETMKKWNDKLQRNSEQEGSKSSEEVVL
eukprot:TRINITY_DN12018_c0_g1_i1.p1 TRINITY_DN12018_c0_g1~~TRINITY_DN12018_c0_g1_i1.p1  ORF type:complete len:433 (-),score=37.01 TRINITY_DN12018_c0_g1_i1:179-1477(-)